MHGVPCHHRSVGIGKRGAMATIWQHDGAAWNLLPSSGFPDEAALHSLIEHAPQILPVSGEQRLVVVGREVQLGGNWADLVAIEASGRLAIVEIKLGKNAEARRAVVAQVLTYASFLHGLSRDQVEALLAPHLLERGYGSLSEAVSANDQEGAFDPQSFSAGLTQCLHDGGFRLVIVLDEAPPELVRLAGYLAAIAENVVIDLMTVTSYEVAGTKLVVPRRLSLERVASEATSSIPAATGKTGYVAGTDAFATSIDSAPLASQGDLRRLLGWANDLESQGLAKPRSYVGKTNGVTLLPCVRGENVGLVTIWNSNGTGLSFWRSVFERRAPETLKRIAAMPEAPTIGQGTYITSVPDDLLRELTAAYREAADGMTVSSGKPTVAIAAT